MRMWLSDILHFLRAVISHWFYLMAGLVSFSITFWEKIKDKPIAVSTFKFIAIICVFASFFLAWRDEFKLVGDLNTKLDQRQKNIKIADELADFLSEAVVLQNQCVGVTVLPPGKTTFQIYDEWHKKVAKYINEKVSYAESKLFIDSLTIPVPQPPGLSPIDTKTWMLTEQSKVRLKELISRLRVAIG